MPLSIELRQGDQVEINHGDIMVEVRKLTGRRVRLVFHAPRHITISRRMTDMDLGGKSRDHPETDL